MKRLLASVALLVSVVAVPPGAQMGMAAEAKSDREAAAQAVLDQREEAIRTKDRERFLATVDPGADADFKNRQAALFDGLTSVPLASFDLRLRTDEIPDLSAGLDARYAAEDVFLPPVEARYRIKGADDTDAIDAFFYTFIRRDGAWRIASDTDVEDLGLPSTRNLWDFGRLSTATSAHFTMLFDPADRRRARALLDLAEQAWNRLAGSFDRPVPAQVVMVLPHNLEQLREMLQATFDLRNFVAFASSSIDRDQGYTSTAARVYVQDVNLSRSQREFQTETLHHELVHVASFPLAGPFVSNWVHEGVADWLATGSEAAEAAAGTDGVLPEDYEFTTGGATSIVGSYAESTSAVAFLAGAEGERAPLDLLVAAGRPRVEPGTSAYHLDRGLREVYGAGLPEFQKAWDGGR